MKSDDVALIQRILNGDQNAFASLVRKYQQQIHTFVWGKIDDFQIAEDIVQETFLQVYQKLDTLENPTQFTRWLHQIAHRRCIAWIRKNRIQTEPLEETDISEIEAEAYSEYVATEQAKTTAEAQRDLVEKLLAKLKERDREVIMLHYFEEMSSPEIGKSLGVSENTIKSRLHRARQQLKKYEFMIQEVLDITTEGRHHSHEEMKGEPRMAKETRDEAKIEARLKELQRQIADLQQEIRTIASQSDSFHADNMEFHDPEKSEALRTLCRLPITTERPISWGYIGGYRTAPGQIRQRMAFWSSSIDNFLSNAPDIEIAEFANLFTNPTVIAVLRQLVEDEKSVADLAQVSGIPESEVKETVETLMKATLVLSTEDNLIKPHNDAVSFFLNFVSMTTVHLGHTKSDR